MSPRKSTQEAPKSQGVHLEANAKFFFGCMGAIAALFVALVLWEAC